MNIMRESQRRRGVLFFERGESSELQNGVNENRKKASRESC